MAAEDEENQSLMDTEDSEERAAAPCSSFAVTAAVAILILLTWVLSFILQVIVAIVTLPLLCISRERFHHIQSSLFRGMNAVIAVGLNPFWRVSVRHFGEQSEERTSQKKVGSILFVNHRSNADPWFVAWVQLLQCIEARYVYKATLKKIPFAGCCCMLAGDLDVRFGDKEQIDRMLDRARDVLNSGHNIVVFPEGTRSPSGLLQAFKPSFVRICAELDAPAVPLCLFGTESAWPQSGLRMGCAKVTAVLGKPIWPGQAGADGLSAAVASTFHEMAQELHDDGLLDENDPFITAQPYPWWKPPAEFEDMSNEEQLALLRAGKMHERGAKLI